jgi:hypothetical protein
MKDNNKSFANWSIKFISIVSIAYLIFSLISPIFFKDEHRQPRKIENPDLVLITIILLFNSGLINRLEDFGISNSGVTAKFQQLKQEVNEQQKQIDAMQAQQLEALEKHQKNLAELQVFMYNFLLGAKDYEKIEQLEKHLQAQTSYNCYISDSVGDELRHLRDLKLVALKSGYISDLINASDHGKKAIDLTQYLYVTDLGKKFLLTHKTLQASNSSIINNQELA